MKIVACLVVVLKLAPMMHHRLRIQLFLQWQLLKSQLVSTKDPQVHLSKSMQLDKTVIK
jgi:hypothetical protein